MATKKKATTREKLNTPSWGAFTLESNASRLTNLRRDLLRDFVQAAKPYGKEQPLSRSEMELWAKDAIVIADILFEANK